MLVQLLKEQIANDWSFIGDCIERSLPVIADPENTRMSQILEALLYGRMQCWYFYEDVNDLNELEESKLLAVITTVPILDLGALYPCLLIYSFFGVEKFVLKMFSSFIADIRRVAKAASCKKVIAYTNIQGLKQLAVKLGGNADISVIYIDA